MDSKLMCILWSFLPSLVNRDSLFFKGRGRAWVGMGAALAFFGFACLQLAAHAANCEDCAGPRSASQKLQTDLQNHEALLQRNKDYLGRLDPSEASKAIKVKSNIVILAVRIETIKNNLSVAQSDLQSKGCDQCPTN